MSKRQRTCNVRRSDRLSHHNFVRGIELLKLVMLIGSADLKHAVRLSLVCKSTYKWAKQYIYTNGLSTYVIRTTNDYDHLLFQCMIPTKDYLSRHNGMRHATYVPFNGPHLLTEMVSFSCVISINGRFVVSFHCHEKFGNVCVEEFAEPSYIVPKLIVATDDNISYTGAAIHFYLA